jgi:hypothetical protein
MTKVPEVYSLFDIDFKNYKEEKIIEMDSCPICTKNKPVFNKYCSLSCSSKSKFKVDWDNINLTEMLKNDTIINVAEKLNISDAAVRKRLKKIIP